MTSSIWRVKNDDLPTTLQSAKNCLRQALPEELGTGYSDVFQLDADLSYIETHYAPNKNIAVLSTMQLAEPRMVVTLSLKGQSCFTHQHGDALLFKQGYTSIATVNNSIGERQYQAHQDITQLRLSLSKKWLDRYLGEARSERLFNHANTQLLTNKAITPQGRIAAQQLLSTQAAPELQRVFMHAQALSLLAAELNGLYQAEHKFTARDKAIAYLAQDILQQEYQNPPSVAELAIRTGTNQCKLKKLFEHFFNSTPYGMLLDIRMNKAYQLLVSSRCQVSVAADAVGYKHANNFSVAFTRYFGITPKQLIKH